MQIADRWHLLRNLCEAVHAVVEHYHAAIRAVERNVAVHYPCRATLSQMRSAAQRCRETGQLRRQARYAEIIQTHMLGASISHIARHLVTDRKALRGWLLAWAAPSWSRRQRGSALDQHHSTLERRWTEDCHTAAPL